MFCLRILQCSCPELRFLYLHLRLVETLFNALMLAPSTIPVKPASTPHMQYFGELPISAPCGLPGTSTTFLFNVCTRLPHVWNRGFPTGILTKPRVAQFIANFHHLNIHFSCCRSQIPLPGDHGRDLPRPRSTCPGSPNIWPFPRTSWCVSSNGTSRSLVMLGGWWSSERIGMTYPLVMGNDPFIDGLWWFIY